MQELQVLELSNTEREKNECKIFKVIKDTVKMQLYSKEFEHISLKKNTNGTFRNEN